MHGASNGSMKSLIISAFAAGWAVLALGQEVNHDTGPAAALRFAMSYRGHTYVPGVVQCYPDAEGIPFSDTKNIIPMTGSLWTPAELAADFKLRMAGVSEKDRKRGYNRDGEDGTLLHERVPRLHRDHSSVGERRVATGH